jgi:RHS repeat-associated protein
LPVHDYSWSQYGLIWESNPNTMYTPGFGHRSNGVNSFYHTDWLGSTRYTSTDGGTSFPQGLRFDAFGNRSATMDPAAYHPGDLQYAGAHGYQTDWASATEPGLGLNYLEQRYYDPAIGRFISPDPIGLAGGLNLYGYCGNDAVNCVDPTGEFGWLLVVVLVAVLTDVSAKPADVPAPGFVNDPASCQVYRAYDRFVEPMEFGYGGLRPDLLETGQQSPGGIPVGGKRLRRPQTKPSPPPTTPPTLPNQIVFQKGEVTFEHHYPDVREHGPAHVHVTGGGKETRIRYGGGPVDGTDEAMTRVQRRAFNEGKHQIQPRINKLGRWLKWMSKMGKLIPRG